MRPGGIGGAGGGTDQDKLMVEKRWLSLLREKGNASVKRRVLEGIIAGRMVFTLVPLKEVKPVLEDLKSDADLGPLAQQALDKLFPPAPQAPAGPDMFGTASMLDLAKQVGDLAAAGRIDLGEQPPSHSEIEAARLEDEAARGVRASSSSVLDGSALSRILNSWSMTISGGSEGEIDGALHGEPNVAAVNFAAGRPKDQDACLIRYASNGKRSVLIVVGDGIGKQAKGEIASQTAMDKFDELMGQDPEGFNLDAALDAANRAILEARKGDPKNDMGTTAVAALITEKIFIAGVGDSHAYRFRDGKLTIPIPEDSHAHDDYVRTFENMGEPVSFPLDFAQSGDYHDSIRAFNADGANPYRHKITAALGMTTLPVRPPYVGEPRKGDIYILASDGLDLPWEVLLKVITDNQDKSALEIARALMAAVKNPHDNITITVWKHEPQKTELERALTPLVQSLVEHRRVLGEQLEKAGEPQRKALLQQQLEGARQNLAAVQKSLAEQKALYELQRLQILINAQNPQGEPPTAEEIKRQLKEVEGRMENDGSILSTEKRATALEGLIAGIERDMADLQAQVGGLHDQIKAARGEAKIMLDAIHRFEMDLLGPAEALMETWPELMAIIQEGGK